MRIVDPRTLETVGRYADCHIIPACFNVSSLTVRLDESIDNKIGTICDSQLQRYFATLLGTMVRGRLSIKDGASRLAASFDSKTDAFRVRMPRGGNAADFVSRALASDGKHIGWQRFDGDTVDCCAAHLSMIHSGFLLMYYLGKPNVYNSHFDWVRGLIERTTKGKLTDCDWELVRERAGFTFSIPTVKATSGEIPVTAFREHYDPTFDPGDGVYADFPFKSVQENNEVWVVTLPYSQSLRVEIKFPKAVAPSE